ncbi:MAG: TIGR03960 family B12-binding radical SAM protein [Abditibacteriota bacterium]|nr:TIGR03960 family B12-binding radical SAM protein [Abditibacteriota bacterium]
MENTEIRKKVFSFLHKVEKPGRYTGGELNSAEAAQREVRVCLCFPDIYEVGMSNLGLRILYSVLNDCADSACERCFAPAGDMAGLMEENGVPLYSLESFSPLSSFDAVGFSMAYELCYPTVLDMLRRGGIPVFSRERTAEDPVIIAGGHTCTNPAPMEPFIDAFAIGDGEKTILKIKEAVKGRKKGRAAVLEALSRIPGVYVPGVSGGAVKSDIVSDMDKAPFPRTLVIPNIRIVHERVMLEVMRGCSRGCRFCQAGFIQRPVREKSLNTLLREAEALCIATGYEEIALTSLSSTDHSQIEPLVDSLTDAFSGSKTGISLPSIRADVSCVKLADRIQSVRKSGLTFAPEAGSQRLRNVINKNLTEEDLFSSVEAAAEKGWKRVKLYFMIGLPYETDEDALAICDLVGRLRKHARTVCPSFEISITVSPFVPKPHTPFQRQPMADAETLERRISLVRSGMPRGVRLSWHEPAASRLEAALARGGAELAGPVYSAFRMGARLEQDDYSEAVWNKAFAEHGLNIEECACRRYEETEALPWDNINVGVKSGFLIEENRRAEKGITTPDCRTHGCNGCMEYTALCASRGKNEAEVYKPSVPLQDRNGRVGTALFRFSKGPRLRFISHLDLMGVFERAVRISGAPVWFSRGFNPKPGISLGPALALGATAENDVFFMRVHLPENDLPQFAENLKNSLDAALPPAVSLRKVTLFDDIKRLPPPEASLYSLKVNAPREELERVRRQIMSEDALPVVRKKERKEKTVDLKPLIKEMTCGDGVIKALLPHLENTAKPSEIFGLFADRMPGLDLKEICRSDVILPEGYDEDP